MTLADQLRTRLGTDVWGLFSSPSLKTALTETPTALQQSNAEILAQRIGLPVAYTTPEPVAPPINWPLRIGLGLGAFAVIGFFVHLRRRS